MMSLLSVADAQAQLHQAAQAHVVRGQRLVNMDLLQATGYVLAEGLHSPIHVPNADNSAMDGYAFAHADWHSDTQILPISQRVPAGAVPVPLQPGTAARIFTGAPLPAGADTVIMQEMTELSEQGVRFTQAVKLGNAVRLVGSDIRAGSAILEPGIVLRPQDIALAASTGVANVTVHPRLRVRSFFTGDEVRMPGETLGMGQVYNSNRFLLQGLMRGLPVEYADLGVVKDSLEATRIALRQAAEESDLVITTGGVSVGEEDHIKAAVQAEGELSLWQIAIKPGKPLAYGKIRRQDGSYAAFIGLPGNPVSSFVTMLILVRPFILSLAGVRHIELQPYSLRADFDWPKPDKRREFLRVKRNASGGLALFPVQQSGVLTSTVWADGLVDVLPGQTIAQGDMVSYIPFAELL